MEYQGIRKVHEGKFITRYDVDYVTAEGNPDRKSTRLNSSHAT